MADRVMPRYPVYVPSKSRWVNCLTAKFLIDDGVPFHLVVEPSEKEQYGALYGYDRLLVMPRDDMKLLGARNWIMDHAIASGAERHWQLDDNMRMTRRWYNGKRIRCRSGLALRVVEDLSDRYENVAISGLEYTMFSLGGKAGKPPKTPFIVNGKVYSCSLLNSKMPFRWRLVYNDDTDICLQALAGGWCTICVRAFMVDKIKTMTMKGGNTNSLYQADGRLRMARSLERVWPGVVETHRRFQRPQHVVKYAWGKFDTALIPREGASTEFELGSEYGMELLQRRDIKANSLREWAGINGAKVADDGSPD